MLNRIFESKFPFAYKYFSSLLDFVLKKERKFPQALIFEGADTKNQYLFALELARILNCQKDANPDCDCINCKWIKTYSHPSVNIISQIHFKPDDDTSKTVISVKQAREIEKSLTLSCDYHRFFIFFSSKEQDSDCSEFSDFKKLGYNDNINFSIEPLNYQTFYPSTPNALLKSIEEPPENTTFVFLTKSKEDILSTIVSRCLVFKLGSKFQESNNSTILDVFSKYPSITYEDAFEISQSLQKIEKENNLNIESILNQFLEFLKETLKKNLNNPSFSLKINNDIFLVGEAIKQTRANMSSKIVLDTLFLRIVRGF